MDTAESGHDILLGSMAPFCKGVWHLFLAASGQHGCVQLPTKRASSGCQDSHEAATVLPALPARLDCCGRHPATHVFVQCDCNCPKQLGALQNECGEEIWDLNRGDKMQPRVVVWVSGLGVLQPCAEACVPPALGSKLPESRSSQPKLRRKLGIAAVPGFTRSLTGPPEYAVQGMGL